jgi:hypothetical protein
MVKRKYTKRKRYYRRPARDYKLQCMNVSVTEGAANTFTTEESALPMPKTNARVGSYVVEVVRVEYDCKAADQEPTNSAAGPGTALEWEISTKELSEISGIAEPHVIGSKRLVTNMTTSGVNQTVFPLVQEFHDGKGNGTIVAGDRLNFACKSTGEAAARTYSFRIYYRFSLIRNNEYIGLVQTLLSY